MPRPKRTADKTEEKGTKKPRATKASSHVATLPEFGSDFTVESHNALLRTMSSPPERIEAFPAWFQSMAHELVGLGNVTYLLMVNGMPHRIREVEAYRNCPIHPDPYAHCSWYQRHPARWYIHRGGPGKHASYRGGTYKGLDLTFGTLRDDDADDADNDPEHAGFLIRCIEQLAPTRKIIDGPCRVVDHVLSLYGAASLDALVANTRWVDPHLAAFPACTPPVASRLQIIAVRLSETPQSWRDHCALIRSPRVGLTLKKLADHPNQWQFLARPYRFISQWSAAAAPIARPAEPSSSSSATAAAAPPSTAGPAAAAAAPSPAEPAAPAATAAAPPPPSPMDERRNRWLDSQPTAEALQAVFGPALLRHLTDPAAALLGGSRDGAPGRLLIPPPAAHPLQNGRPLAVIGLRAWEHLNAAQIAPWVAANGRAAANIEAVVEAFDRHSRAAQASAAAAEGGEASAEAGKKGAKKGRRTDTETADSLVAVLSECIGRNHT